MGMIRTAWTTTGKTITAGNDSKDKHDRDGDSMGRHGQAREGMDMLQNH